jgi:hypothetical protein
MAKKRKFSHLTPSQIRAMNDLGGYPVISEPPTSSGYHVYVNKKEMYSIFTGKKEMTLDDAQQNLIAFQAMDSTSRVVITKMWKPTRDR